MSEDKVCEGSRHNRVFTYIGEGLKQVGYTVIEEPTISTISSNRRPDLVVSRGNAAAVIDITIVANNASSMSYMTGRSLTIMFLRLLIRCG